MVPPVASAIQVSGDISITFGGVPRVWRGPGTHCVAPNGGTRTSTALPGASAASSSSKNRTAVATTLRSDSPARTACTAANPSCSAIRRRAMGRSLPGQQAVRLVT